MRERTQGETPLENYDVLSGIHCPQGRKGESRIQTRDPRGQPVPCLAPVADSLKQSSTQLDKE